jgi:rhomboid protease GluP
MGSSPPPGFSTHAPEILPPEGNAAQQEELRAVRDRLPGERSGTRSWAYAPATYTLVAINCLVFLAMVFSHVSFFNPSVNDLMHWGANSTGAVLYDGQWFRVVAAMFVHVGILHLATNMWCLWNLGLLGEPLIGPFGVFAAYILSGAGQLAFNRVEPRATQGFGGGRGIGRGLWDCRGADCVAEVAAVADSTERAQWFAALCNLLCCY